MKGSGTALLAIFTVAGCVTAHTFVGPHGEEMRSISCGGFATMDDCYAEARKQCAGNYDVVDLDRHTDYLTQADDKGATITPVAARELTVVCANAPPPAS